MVLTNTLKKYKNQKYVYACFKFLIRFSKSHIKCESQQITKVSFNDFFEYIFISYVINERFQQ